jgi:hypothetical protein
MVARMGPTAPVCCTRILMVLESEISVRVPATAAARWLCVLQFEIQTHMCLCLPCSTPCPEALLLLVCKTVAVHSPLRGSTAESGASKSCAAVTALLVCGCIC